MATVTTNYSFDIPQSSDLVKDGATAIATLGQDIDTAMFTALGTKKAGMVLLNTTSFSGVTTQSFNNVFSSTYDNYKILVTTSSDADTDFSIRLRAGGTDNSTASSYIIQRLTANSTTVAGVRLTTSYWQGFNIFNDNNNAIELTLFRPFLASRTLLTGSVMYSLNNAVFQGYVGQHNQSTSYDGFTFYGATFTGTISIYGFNK
jgi:hypothetical protein